MAGNKTARTPLARRCAIGVAAFALSLTAASAQPGGDPLLQGFLTPPKETYPGGNMGASPNLDGLRTQLERLKTLGTNQLHMGTAQGAYMTPAWKEMVGKSVALAGSMGFTVAPLTSPGVSHSGDSLVLPEEGMKKVVWSATDVAGGKRFSGRLAAPPIRSGPYQNIANAAESQETISKDIDFYRDVAVMAYRLGDATPVAKAVVTSSAGPIAADAGPLVAGPVDLVDAANPIKLTAKDGSFWLRADYPTPQTIRSAVLATPETRTDDSMFGDLQALGEDGRYTKVTTIETRGAAHITVSFPAVRSKSFRLVLQRHATGYMARVPGPEKVVALNQNAAAGNANQKGSLNVLPISAFALLGEARNHEFERKAGYFLYVNDYYALNTNPASIPAATKKADVIDLTGKLKPDGTLDWTAPAGRWRIIRMGYSLTGKIAYASTESTGLEADKLNPAHMAKYWNRYLGAYAEMDKNVTGTFSDSTETGPQNWTEDMLTEFAKRRGYDARPFLPTLMGAVIESPAVTDKFLWDFRQTISEMTTEYVYGQMQTIAKAKGLRTEVEAQEHDRHQLGDDYEMRRYADVPMAALWASEPTADYLREFPNQVADQKGATSIAHVYGRPVAGSESATDLVHPFAFSPLNLKPIIDMQFVLGMNWMMKTFPPANETWASYARQWTDYQARSSFLLRQGKPTADVAYFYGEDTTLNALRERLNDVPKRNGFDYVNPNVLLNVASVTNGKLTTPSGMSYSVLQLGGSSSMMTVKTLRRIRDLVQSGLAVVGAAPLDTPSLGEDQAEFRGLKAQLWGADGRGAKLGAGQVFGAQNVDQALASLTVAPELTASGGTVGDDIMFLRRTLPDGEMYYVVSRSDKVRPVELSFRLSGKAPEIWRADTAERGPASYRIENGRTIMPVTLQPRDALFVMFRTPTTAASRVVAPPKQETLVDLNGDWQVSFPADRGGPAQPVGLKPGLWTANAAPGIKYFSGTAIYTRTVNVPASALSGGKVMLDLGDVGEIADVSVNGALVGVRWTPPYALDVTKALKAGKNTIEVKVTNRWFNRLVGDTQPGAKPIAKTFNVAAAGRVSYRADTPLKPSGLIGPAALIRER